MKLCIKLISVDSHFPISSDKVKVLLGDDVISFFYFLSKEYFTDRKPHNCNKITPQSPSASAKTLWAIDMEMNPTKRVEELYTAVNASMIMWEAKQLEKKKWYVYKIFTINYK